MGYIHSIRSKSGIFLNFFNLGFIQISNIAVQLLLFPIILRTIGIESFGLVTVINAYSLLAGVFINYGTNQSGIKDIALVKDNNTLLSQLFFTIYHTRFLLCSLSVLIILALYWVDIPYINYILFALPIILAETINPIFFFTGIEKLTLYNTSNLLAKISSALMIIFLFKPDAGAYWINFYLGMGNLIFYCIVFFYAIFHYQIKWQPIAYKRVKNILKENSYLISNNITVHIQQSFFLFVLQGFSNPTILGAYSLGDKVISSVRMLIVAFTYAIYPNVAIQYKVDKANWIHYKNKMNRWLGISFILFAMGLFFGADLIVQLLTGTQNQLSSTYIKTVSLVPLFMALNTLNMIEFLIKNQYKKLFYCSVGLFLFSLLTGSFFILFIEPTQFGFYTLFIEIAAIVIVLFVAKKKQA
ncbi:oligosaccharide flippase family protein [Sediminibacterium sp.]|uniref:oligosaccharide flippase family protein n=1 Tax=Sediminibacterium sp. TaxID=1917865 RepID=UPI00272F4248|nr:oligosaccharide flippase family protein [Sediminibacterium sp.]MDP2420275.1 oligosaccharide flippase family protein [Sediminibacterium sp.]